MSAAGVSLLVLGVSLLIGIGRMVAGETGGDPEKVDVWIGRQHHERINLLQAAVRGALAAIIVGVALYAAGEGASL